MSERSESKKALRHLEAKSTGYGSGRTRILLAAEKLFGEKGIENVSLRQISVAAGQANNSAVALHFGTKEGLIAAIIKARRPIIDHSRQQRLNAALAKGELLSLRTLIECLMMPWADDTDENGKHPYACFIAQLMWSERNFYPFDSLSSEAPISSELIQRIRTHTHHLDEAEFELRIRLMFQMFLTTALHRGHVNFSNSDGVSGQAVFDKVVDITAIVLLAPA